MLIVEASSYCLELKKRIEKLKDYIKAPFRSLKFDPNPIIVTTPPRRFQKFAVKLIQKRALISTFLLEMIPEEKKRSLIDLASY